jgi:hypothetical protein
MLQIIGKTYPFMAVLVVSLTTAVAMDEKQPLLGDEERQWDMGVTQELGLDSYLQELTKIADDAEAESLNKKHKDRWKGKMVHATEKMEKDKTVNKRVVPLEKSIEKRQRRVKAKKDLSRRDPFRIFEPDPRY